jgi:hypothetical protein
MNLKQKIAGLAVFLGLCLAVSGFTQTTDELQALQDNIKNFSQKLASSLALNSGLGLNWSDAYIGQVFPSMPPHFGVGVSGGFTTINLDSVERLLGSFQLDVPADLRLGQMINPGYTVEGRVGGLFLPFDVGFKAGVLPPLAFGDIKLKYILIGGDLRYAVLEGPALPTVSVGLGLNYLEQGIDYHKDGTISFKYQDRDLNLDDPSTSLGWEAYSLDFKAQISKSFLLITPYLGLGASYTWSRAGYSVTISNTLDQTVRQELKDKYNIDARADGIEYYRDDLAFGFRAFGGLSLNIFVIKLDLTGLYSFLDNNYGLSLGLRFQL